MKDFQAKIPFVREEMSIDEAIKLLNQWGRSIKWNS